MIKKIFSNKIYFLITLLVLLVLLSIIASVSKNNPKLPNLNPFVTNNTTNTDTKTLNQIEDPVLKFFLDQNTKLKTQMDLVNQIDQDTPTPVIVWKVDFK